MLETFCASANLKSLLGQHNDMPVVRKYNSILEQAMTDHSRDVFAGTTSPEFEAHTTTPSTRPKRRQQSVLSERAIDALQSMYQNHFNRTMPSATACHSKHAVGKVTFTTRMESKRDCNIIFRSTVDNTIAPGVIQYIISVPSPSRADNEKSDFFVVVEQYAQLPDNVGSNPFSSHEAFGASLWSSKMSPVLNAIPMDHIICHSISRQWAKEVILIKALDRVSSLDVP